MYSNGQTLRHKLTNAIVRLAVRGDSAWAWEIGEQTAFIDAEGKAFAAPIDDYINFEDEFGRAVCGTFDPKLPDLSLKRYILTPAQRLKLKRASLRRIKQEAVAFETKVLSAMRGEKPAHNSRVIILGDHLTPPQLFGVSAHFPTVNRDFNPYIWFIKRRGGKVLYRTLDRWNGKRQDGAYTFRYAGKRWIWEGWYAGNWSSDFLIRA